MTGINKLNGRAVANAAPRERAYKLADGAGLYLLVKPTGGKYWRLSYRFAGKQKSLALGVCCDTSVKEAGASLKEARAKRDEARWLLNAKIDPAQQRKHDKVAAELASETTFKFVAKQWIEKKANDGEKRWKPRHVADVLRSLENDIFPDLGGLPIHTITSPMLLAVLKKVQNRGSLETTRRLRQRCSKIFQYGIAYGACKTDPAQPLNEVLLTPKVRNLAAITFEELPTFIHKFNRHNCRLQTRLAMRLMMLTFVRTGELIGGRWAEIDFEQALWNIPAHRMKKPRPHYVPLSTQAIETLEQLHEITGHRELMFPKTGDPKKTMSNGTLLRVIDRIGYRNRMTGHGFRSIASTELNESGKFRYDVIEAQLAHEQESNVRRAYNRAQYLIERRELMQWWADRLDGLEHTNVVSGVFEKQAHKID